MQAIEEYGKDGSREKVKIIIGNCRGGGRGKEEKEWMR